MRKFIPHNFNGFMTIKVHFKIPLTVKLNLNTHLIMKILKMKQSLKEEECKSIVGVSRFSI
jgi:hypothetical protein